VAVVSKGVREVVRGAFGQEMEIFTLVKLAVFIVMIIIGISLA
jgi:hypothetical protein